MITKRGKRGSELNDLMQFPAYELQRRIDQNAEEAYAVHQERAEHMRGIQSLGVTDNHRANLLNDAHRRKGRASIASCDRRLGVLASRAALLQEALEARWRAASSRRF